MNLSSSSLSLWLVDDNFHLDQKKIIIIIIKCKYSEKNGKEFNLLCVELLFR